MDFATADVDLRERLPRDLLRLTRAAVWVLALCELWAISTILVRRAPLMGVDARAYWLAWRRTMYLAGPNTDTAAYLYSPAFAQLTWPLTLIPWFWVFAALWSTGNAALLVWMLRPLGWAWAVPLALLLSDEVLNGNIFIPLAAMCVLGFRYPRVWAFSPLTKVAPTVMPIWWLARREWRPLASWAVTTLAVVVVSAAVAPDLWKQCVAHMAQWATESGATIGFPLMGPLLYRAPVGLALIVTGALKGWLWTVPVAALLLTPVFWLGGLAWLAAIPRIQREERRGMNRPVRLDAGDWLTQREESNETDLNKARNDLSPQ